MLRIVELGAGPLSATVAIVEVPDVNVESLYVIEATRTGSTVTFAVVVTPGSWGGVAAIVTRSDATAALVFNENFADVLPNGIVTVPPGTRLESDKSVTSVACVAGPLRFTVPVTLFPPTTSCWSI